MAAEESASSLWTRIRNYFLGGFRSEWITRREWNCRFNPWEPEFETVFFVERTPVEILVILTDSPPLPVESLKFEEGGEMVPVEHEVTTEPHGAGSLIHILPSYLMPTKAVTVTFAGRQNLPSCEVRVRIQRASYHDRTLLNSAFAKIDSGDVDGGVQDLLEYDEIVPENPIVSGVLARYHRGKGEFRKAEFYFLRTMVTGTDEDIRPEYENLQGQFALASIQHVRDLQKDAAEWQLGPHHGLVVLEKKQEFLLDLNGFHLRKCREIMEIRRPAAARMLRRLGFPFSGGKEYLIHTSLRIIHGDDQIEDVSPGNFMVSDAEEKNIFIAVEDEKSGNWILPDLTSGDVIEWTYHLLRRDLPLDRKPHCFILTSLFNQYTPTFRAISEFIAPKEWSGTFTCLHMEEEPREVEKSLSGVRFHAISGGPYIPRKYTGFPYENNYLNPLVVCSSNGPDWAEIAQDALKRNFGSNDLEGEIPGPIKAAMAEGTSPEESLEKAFYWIRDKLKYASLAAGHRHIGREDRAAEIVKAGTGDCKDKTYLLSLVCRSLGIPCNVVAISTSQGLTIEDHPADQFDHVFLRAKLDSRWVFLDAASVLSPFGNAPAWCQGMKVLVLDGDGSIIRIPVDDPSANHLRIVETFHARGGSWLEGTFEMRATGHLGRLMDDRWKTYSLAMSDPIQAAQEALRLYFPFTLISEAMKLSDTSRSGEFRVSGKHRRGPLISLGKRQLDIGRLSWELPSLPISYWRGLQIDKLFVVDFPMEAVLEVDFLGDLSRCVNDISRVEPLTNGIADVSHDATETPDSIGFRRAIRFKRKYIQDELLAEAFPTLERIEEALQLVLSFEGPAEVGGTPAGI